VSKLLGVIRSGDVLSPDLTQRRAPAPGGVKRLVPAGYKIAGLRHRQMVAVTVSIALSKMGDHLVGSDERASHWDHVYECTDTKAVSWYRSDPDVSLELIDLLGLAPGSSVIDVGGGASTLVDHLLTRGFSDLTVLDISQEALHASRERVGDAPVTWLTADLLIWEPTRTYELWRDRAVFHFLSGSEVEHYRTVLLHALPPSGAVIMATFAPDGPERCSGLPLSRYSGTNSEKCSVVDSRLWSRGGRSTRRQAEFRNHLPGLLRGD